MIPEKARSGRVTCRSQLKHPLKEKLRNHFSDEQQIRYADLLRADALVSLDFVADMFYNCIMLKYLDRCRDSCEIYIQTTSNSIHYACLRCREHGHLKWISYRQAQELPDVLIER